MPDGGLGCRQWRVAGAVSENAAVPFWSGLLDELIADHPPGTRLALAAAMDGPLLPARLDPARELEAEMEALAGRDLRRACRETLAVLALTGPPPGVRLRLTRAGRKRPLVARTLDTPDAETFAFLLAWLLHWAGLPAARWNDGAIDAGFDADDPARRRRYAVRFRLVSRYLSEGLFEREVEIDATVAS